MIEQIIYQNQLIALIIAARFNQPGIHFFTPPDFSQQLGYINHPVGKIIQPHIHNHVTREVQFTQEVLFLRKGKLRADFYSCQQEYIKSYVLESGDVILLVNGGHGFEVIEEIEMIEVKQGPYIGERDRIKFNGIGTEKVKLVEYSKV
jgi:mannose-6-phosphate isomerase-like protein (cupin superfamily)